MGHHAAWAPIAVFHSQLINYRSWASWADKQFDAQIISLWGYAFSNLPSQTHTYLWIHSHRTEFMEDWTEGALKVIKLRCQTLFTDDHYSLSFLLKLWPLNYFQWSTLRSTTIDTIFISLSVTVFKRQLIIVKLTMRCWVSNLGHPNCI